MKRLTERRKNGAINVRYATEHETAIHRLAAIEDILGDEYDLDRLRELAEADREGRCVVLNDLTVADLQQMLTVLDCTHYGDGAETYATGYRNGHRNGRIEILRYVLEINEGDSVEAEAALKERKFET